MLTPVALRLSRFCDLTGTPKPTMMDRRASEDLPFNPKAVGGGHRAYYGADLFAWEVDLALREAGLSRERASKTVRYSGAIEDFLARAGAGDDVRDHFICFVESCPENATDEAGEAQYRAVRGADMSALISEITANGGQLKSLVTVQLRPIYHKAKAKALAKGYVLNFGDLYAADEFQAFLDARERLRLDDQEV